MTHSIFKSRLRGRGQVTIPSEIREILNLSEGDDLAFRVNEEGQIVIEKQVAIPADQAWFWTERWQRMEREAQADIEADRVSRYESVDQALDSLEQDVDATNRNH